MAEPKPKPASVTCTFFDKSKHLIVEHPVKIDTGLGARMIAVRNAAQDMARDKGYPLFAISAEVEGSLKWLTFRMNGRIADFVKAWPNRESAKMWMQHSG